MKTKLMWFATGFVVSWLVWSAISYVRLRPRDLTSTWSQSDKEIPVSKWLKSAVSRKVGGYAVFAPAIATNSSAMIYPATPNQSPKVGFEDFDNDGKPDFVFISDSKRTISIGDKNGDGMIDAYHFTLEEASVSYYDSNADGEYDSRLGPGNSDFSVFIESNWHKLILKGKLRYIDVDGTLIQVELAGNGVWKIAGKE